MRASLARETTGALPLLRLADSITSSPLETHPLSLFLPSRALFLRPAITLSHSHSLSSFRSPSLLRYLDDARVPFLLSRLRFPRPPSFLYTTSFAVVGEGETPAFAVGEAVLFFPLIKADRCGSGCRDDGTRERGGGWCTGWVGGKGREETEAMG